MMKKKVTNKPSKKEAKIFLTEGEQDAIKLNKKSLSNAYKEWKEGNPGYTYNVEYIIKNPQGKIDSTFRSIRSAARWYIACETYNKFGFTLERVTQVPKDVRVITLEEAKYVISKTGAKI